MKSKLISISAISAGLTALFLTVGAYFEVVDLFMVVVTSVFVVLPLYFKSFKACFLAYLAGGTLAFMLSGFNVFSVVFPAYFGFFGLYPIIRMLMQEKKVKKLVIYIIGVIWCVASIFGIYFLYLNLIPEFLYGLPEWVVNNIYYIVGLLGVALYFLFDASVINMRRFTDRYLSRIIK